MDQNHEYSVAMHDIHWKYMMMNDGSFHEGFFKAVNIIKSKK